MKREIDFNKPRAFDYRGRQAKRDGTGASRAVIAMLLIIAAVIAVSSAWLSLRRQVLVRQTEELQQYLISSDDKKREEQLLEIQGKYVKLKQKNEAEEEIQAVVETYPRLSAEDYAALIEPLAEGMTLRSLAYDQTGILSAVFSCKSQKDVPDYVERVQNGGAFSLVSYSGWSLDEVYTFRMSCLLKGEEETK